MKEQSTLFPVPKKKKSPNEIEGKTDYGERKPLTFWLHSEDFEKAKRFFNYKEEHDEPDAELLMRLINND